MPSLERIHELPDNIDAFVDEIAPGLGSVYGPAAEQEYRREARQRFAVTLAHPLIETLACVENGQIAGLAWSTTRDGLGYVGFVHVLKPWTGHNLEGLLVAQAVADRRRDRVKAIVCECMSFGEMDLPRAFEEAGFSRVERLLMAAPLSAPGLAFEGIPSSKPCAPLDWPAAAAVILDAYRDHPDRFIHPDVHDTVSCERFVGHAARGAYGDTRESYLRLLSCDGKIAATALGCEVAPGTGFVLQVAVRPEFQGRGLGTRLMRELAHEFRLAGLTQVALGVTVSNPARRLYERLGFERRRAVDAYVWWRSPRAAKGNSQR